MRLFIICLGLVMGLLTFDKASAETHPCQVEAPCVLEDGDYLLRFPENWDGTTPLPAIVFYHGFRGSAEGVLKGRSLKTAFSDHGYLVIAPNGAIMPGRDVRAWPARHNPAFRDDVDFTRRMIADIQSRVPLDTTRLIASGFSAGGSMVWLLACEASQDFAAFVAISGTLRRPEPVDGCDGQPANMLHLHGYGDRTVPLEGRAIRDWHQGDVFINLDRQRHQNQCVSKPDSVDDREESLRCRHWNDSCQSGHVISFCLHQGGHGLTKGWAEKARLWVEALG